MNPNFVRFVVLCMLLSPAAQAAEVDGILVPADRHVVSVPIEGIVTQVPVHAGQRVNNGDILLQLSQTSYRIHLRQAQAAVKVLEPELEDALREKNDAEVLYEQTVLSDVELQAAQIRYRKLAAQMQQAKAALDLVHWKIGWTAVKAQRDAVVTAVHVVPGQMIAGDLRSRPLLELASPQALQVMAEVPAASVAGLRLGQSLQLKVNGQSRQATIRSISLPSSPSDKARIIARLKNADSLAAGMPATLQLP